MKRFLRRLITGVATLALSTAGVVLQAAPAADSLRLKLAANTSRPIAIVSDVRIRPTPDTSQHWLAVMPAGSHPQYICYADGENEGGTTKWFRVSWNGVEGYYSSIADDMPLSAQGNIEGNYGIPRCGTGTDINQGSASGATINPFGSYDGETTAQWARDHSEDPQPLWESCAWFATQALWAGGLNRTPTWNDYGTHGWRPPLPGSTNTSTLAPALVKFLVTTGRANMVPLAGPLANGQDRFATNAVPEARVGDLIAYLWDASKYSTTAQNWHGHIDHIAVVTSIQPGSYPNVAEWGTSLTGDHNNYVERGWTYSANGSEALHKTVWLRDRYPHAIAYLIRIQP